MNLKLNRKLIPILKATRKDLIDPNDSQFYQKSVFLEAILFQQGRLKSHQQYDLKGIFRRNFWFTEKIDSPKILIHRKIDARWFF